MSEGVTPDTVSEGKAAASSGTRAPGRLSAPTPRVALVIATAVVIGVVLYLGRHALTPFILGALIVYILDPAVGWFSRLRVGRWQVPRGLAVLIVYVIAFVVVVEGLALLLGPLVTQLLNYLRDLPTLLAALEGWLAQLGEIYRSLDLPESIRVFVDDALEDLASGAAGIDFGSLLPIARSILGTAAGFFGFLIIPIWAFYILRDRVKLTANLEAALPAAWRDDVWAVLTIIERIVGRWIRAQILLGLIVGGATYGGLLLLGWFVNPRFLEFAVLLAVIAGLLELLPIIGPIISMIPTLLVAFTTADPLVSVLWVLVLYIGVQQLENAVLVPKIQGDAVELHPSVVIFALIIGGAIAGLVGAILSIPITAAGRGVYRYLFHRLGDEPPAEAIKAVDEPIPAPPQSLPEAAEPADTEARVTATDRADAAVPATDREAPGI